MLIVECVKNSRETPRLREDRVADVRIRTSRFKVKCRNKKDEPYNSLFTVAEYVAIDRKVNGVFESTNKLLRGGV